MDLRHFRSQLVLDTKFEKDFQTLQMQGFQVI
jgi:hypothetical protein